MKIPITLKINRKSKIDFEQFKEIHGKTFTDALALGVKQIMDEVATVENMERKISERYADIHKYREAMAHLT